MKRIFLPIISSLVFLAIACSSTDKKVEVPVEPAKVEVPKTEEVPVVQARSADTGASVDAINEKLAKVSVMGLPPFAASISDEKMDEYGKKALEEAKAATEQLPEGYMLQITGHANQHPDKSKRVGSGLSVKRAKVVYDYFVKNGIAKEKLAYRGAGSAESDEKLSRANNRRVTFKLVKAGAKEE